MPRLFLVPKEGLNIPDPASRPSRPLPAEGGWVEQSQYWDNRLADEDVTDDTAAATEREAAELEAAAKAAEAEAKKAAKPAKPATQPTES